MPVLDYLPGATRFREFTPINPWTDDRPSVHDALSRYVGPLDLVLDAAAAAPPVPPAPPTVPARPLPEIEDLPWCAVHEACHAVAAYRLGGCAVAMLCCSDGEGYTFLAMPSTPEGLAGMATATAIGVLMDRGFMKDPSRSRDDVQKVYEYTDRYMVATLKALRPSAYERAKVFMGCPAFARETRRLAAALELDRVYSRAEVEALMKGESQ